MPYLNRRSFIDLLDRLGDEDEDRVLDAAREIHARMLVAGVGWDALLVAAPATAGGEAGEAAPPPPMPEDDGLVLAALLARTDLSESTREDLTGFQADLVRGELLPDDRSYIRNLYARLTGQG